MNVSLECDSPVERLLFYQSNLIRLYFRYRSVLSATGIVVQKNIQNDCLEEFDKVRKVASRFDNEIDTRYQRLLDAEIIRIKERRLKAAIEELEPLRRSPNAPADPFIALVLGYYYELSESYDRAFSEYKDGLNMCEFALEKRDAQDERLTLACVEIRDLLSIRIISLPFFEANTIAEGLYEQVKSDLDSQGEEYELSIWNDLQKEMALYYLRKKSISHPSVDIDKSQFHLDLYRGNSNDISPSRIRGHIAYRKKLYQDAVQHLLNTLENDPDDYQAIYLIGQLYYFSRGTFREIDEHVVNNKSVLALLKFCPDYQYCSEDEIKGKLSSISSSLEKSLLFFELASIMHPCSSAVSSYIASVYDRLCDFEKAARYYEEALKYAPENWKYVRELAFVKARMGMYDNAITLLKWSLLIKEAGVAGKFGQKTALNKL